MKAKELFKENGELFHKLRTESDIIRHIKTREDTTAVKQRAKLTPHQRPILTPLKLKKISFSTL